MNILENHLLPYRGLMTRLWLTVVFCIPVLVTAPKDAESIGVVLLLVGAFILTQWLVVYGAGPLKISDGRIIRFWLTVTAKIKSWPIGNFQRLLKVLRWTPVMLAYALQFGVQFGTLAFAYLTLTAHTIPGFEGNLTKEGTFVQVGVFLILIVSCVPIGLVVGIGLGWRCTHVLTIRRLVFSILILSIYTSVVVTVTVFLNATVFEYFSQVIWYILLLPVGQGLIALGALLRLWCIQTPSDQSTQLEINDLPTPRQGFSATSSLSSARIFGTVLLVLNYLAIDVATDHVKGMRDLTEARHLFVSLIVGSSPELKEASRDKEKIGISKEIPPFTIKLVKEYKGGGFLAPSQPAIFLVSSQGTRWLANFQSADTNELHEDLKDLARNLEIPPADQTDSDLFFKIQQKIMSSKNVSIPAVGIPVEPARAAWAFAGLAMLLLVLIHARMERVFEDRVYGLNEPWLILDGNRGIPRFAAAGWLLMLILTPWFTHVGLLLALGSQVVAAGGTSNVFDIMAFSLAFCIFIISVNEAHISVIRLIILRRFRKLRETITPSRSDQVSPA